MQQEMQAGWEFSSKQMGAEYAAHIGDKLDSVKWLPADVALISCIKNNMRVQEMLTRKVSVEKLNEEKAKKLWGEIIVGVGGQKIE